MPLGRYRFGDPRDVLQCKCASRLSSLFCPLSSPPYSATSPPAPRFSPPVFPSFHILHKPLSLNSALHPILVPPHLDFLSRYHPEGKLADWFGIGFDHSRLCGICSTSHITLSARISIHLDSSASSSRTTRRHANIHQLLSGHCLLFRILGPPTFGQWSHSFGIAESRI